MLPFCEPPSKAYKTEDLGEVLAGDRPVSSLYRLEFGEDKENEPLCTRALSVKDVAKFKAAVKADYYFQV